MDVILSTIKWQFALVYLDDIVMFLESPSEHNEHDHHILTPLHDAGVTLKLKKCELFSNTINHLEHVIRPGRLKVSCYTVDVIRDLQAFTTVTEL